MLSVVEKVYGRVVIEIMVACTEHQIGERKCGFRSGTRSIKCVREILQETGIVCGICGSGNHITEVIEMLYGKCYKYTVWEKAYKEQ